MRFARNPYITWFPKLSFRVYFQKLFRDLLDTFRDTALSFFSLFFLPKTSSNLFRGMGRCVHSHQMGPGSQIILFGKCSCRIPSGFLPDFTQD